MAKQCIIEGCDNLVSERSRLDACELCRASLNRWKKRSAAAIYQRRQNLDKYSARLQPLEDDTVERIPKSKQTETLSNEKLVHFTRSLVRKK